MVDLNENGKIVSSFHNQDGQISSLKMHNTSNFILWADSSNKIKLWDIKSGKIVSTFTDEVGDKTCIAQFDNDTFITSSRDGLISMWDYRMTAKSLRSNIIRDLEDVEKKNCIINSILYTNGIIFTATDTGIVLGRLYF